MSAVSKGNYYKLKTKKWLEAKGYQVAFMERMMWVFGRKGDMRRLIPVKKDQFGSDLLAMKGMVIGKDGWAEDHGELIFVQVKLNRKNVAEAHKAFGKFEFPEFVEKWIVVWEPRAREPEVIKAGKAETSDQGENGH